MLNLSYRYKAVFAVTMSVSACFSPILRAQSALSSSMIDASVVEPSAQRAPSSLDRSGMTIVPDGFEKLPILSGCLLQMEVYDTPEMSTELRVDDRGNVTVPLLGSVHVAGLTLAGAEEVIAKELKNEQILVRPQVTLNVLEYSGRSISVLGEVHTPGRLPMLTPKPLGDVLALAAGETDSAGNDIEIQHRAENGSVVTKHVQYVRGKNAQVLQDTWVDPGDTVIVHKAGIVYVLGAVNRPGGYLMIDGGALNVTQAVALAGGTTLEAKTRWATVVRPEASGFEQFRVPLHKMETGTATQVMLQHNDVVYVPSSTLKSALINGSNVLSAATSASIYRAQ